MNKAFTLIELLVVISILGLLSSIVLLSLQGAKDRADIGKAQEFSHTIRVSLATNLVGEWRLNDETNPTKDSSGEDNHGILTGFAVPGWTDEGMFDKALVFDGSDDRVYNSSFDYNVLKQGYESSSWTLEAWVKPNGTQAGSERVIVGRSGCHGGIYAYPNDLRFAIKTDACWTNSRTITYIPPDMTSWYHLVAVYDNRDMLFYANGELVGTENLSATMANYSDTIYIGAIGGYAFGGTIDEVRIYNEALSLAQIQQLYAQGAVKHNIVLK